MGRPVTNHSPEANARRIINKLRRARDEGEIAPQWVQTLFERHCDAIGAPVPSTHADVYYPHLLAILDRFGPFLHPSGRAVRDFLAFVGAGPMQVPAALRNLEKAALIERDVQGRRTFRIAITPLGKESLGDWASEVPAFWLPGYEPIAYDPIVEPAPVQNAPLPEPPAVEEWHVAEPDLARLCIHLSVERDTWLFRYEQAEANIDSLVERLKQADAEISDLRKRLSDHDRSQVNTVPISERLDHAERVLLDRLMRELPASR